MIACLSVWGEGLFRGAYTPPPWSLHPVTGIYLSNSEEASDWLEMQNTGRWHWRGNGMRPDSGPLRMLNPSACNAVLLDVPMAAFPSPLSVQCSNVLFPARPFLTPTYIRLTLTPPVAFSSPLIFFPMLITNRYTLLYMYLFVYWLFPSSRIVAPCGQGLLSVLLPAVFPEQRTMPSI